MARISEEIVTEEQIIEMSVSVMAALQQYDPELLVVMDVLLSVLGGTIKQFPTKETTQAAMTYMKEFIDNVGNSSGGIVNMSDRVKTEMSTKH